MDQYRILQLANTAAVYLREQALEAWEQNNDDESYQNYLKAYDEWDQVSDMLMDARIDKSI